MQSHCYFWTLKSFFFLLTYLLTYSCWWDFTELSEK